MRTQYTHTYTHTHAHNTHARMHTHTHIPIGAMTQEKLSFSSKGSLNVFITINIFLTSIDNANIPYTHTSYKHITNTYEPLLRGNILFSKISLASVPSSIKSSLVSTPIVRVPVQEKKVWSIRLWKHFITDSLRPRIFTFVVMKNKLSLTKM